jgi:hypothetical protein
MSNTVTVLHLHNISDRACTLAGPPLLAGLDTTGHPLAFETKPSDTYFGAPIQMTDGTLPVDGIATVYLTSGTGCLDDTTTRRPTPSGPVYASRCRTAAPSTRSENSTRHVD